MKTIVLTGPESTGKSWLAGLLAGHFQTTWLPEYLREFYDRYNGIQKEQMVTVAKRQLMQEEKIRTLNYPVVFYDTNIISLKIYYEYYFQDKPDWFPKLYKPDWYDHYFLLNTDIPWEADSQRSSPRVRSELFPLFKKELERLQVNFTIISGDYKERLEQVKEKTAVIIQ